MAAMVIAGWMQVGLGQNLNDGLVAYYPFRGNANDESGNAHDGQVIGATLEVDRHGTSDSAYRFNGSSVISIKESNLIQFTKSDPVSISLWVKNESSGTVHLLGMRDPSKENGKSNYQIDWTNGALNFRGSPYNNGLEKTGGTLPNNKQQHVVVSYDGKTCKLYLDSTLIMNEAISLGENANTPLLIGGSGNHRKFTGVLDDIRIYNRAITDVEVVDLFFNEKDTDNDGLLDYEEIAIGSDINKVDTDGDGLSNFDEVDLFSTSPIRSDTDGDGLDDGSEIRGGFDPRKPTESADGSISIKVAVELDFFTLTWNNYQLQRSKDLIKWQDIDAPFKGIGGYSSILQPARKDKIYWRLKIIE